MRASDLTPFPKSSNVEGAHYDVGSRVLTVKYKNGGSYTYAGVPPHHWTAIKGADSIGRYLHQNIRSAFKSSRIDVETHR